MSSGRAVLRHVALAAVLAAPIAWVWMTSAASPPSAAPAPASPRAEEDSLSKLQAISVITLSDSAPSPPAGTVPSPAPAPALEFVKPDEVAIEGIVVAPAGEPVAGALVLVSWPMPRTVRACTGADGRFRVAAPPDKRVSLLFVTPKPRRGFRHPVARVEVPAGGTKELIVRLRAGETISGRVVDGDGNGVAGLLLRTRTPPAMSSGAYVAAESATAQDGSFAFDGLPAGFATIEEERPDGSVAEHVLTDAVQVRTGSTALLVRRLAVVEVAGRVTEADGRPAAKRTVVLARRGAALVVEARTDAAGRFRADVATPGEYVVRLRFATQSGHTDRDMGEIDVSVPGEHPFVAPK